MNTQRFTKPSNQVKNKKGEGIKGINRISGHLNNIKRIILYTLFFSFAILCCFPTASIAGNGKLHIASEPEGAEVFLDNRMEGQTPVTIDLAVGTYTLRVEKKDYVPVTREVIVNDSETTELKIKLKKKKKE